VNHFDTATAIGHNTVMKTSRFVEQNTLVTRAREEEEANYFAGLEWNNLS